MESRSGGRSQIFLGYQLIASHMTASAAHDHLRRYLGKLQALLFLVDVHIS